MMTLVAWIGGLALASIPLLLGWRRPVGDGALARTFGLHARGRRLDLEKFARQSGTDLSFQQLALGWLLWVSAGVLVGFLFGPVGAILFGSLSGLLFWGRLAGRREDVRMDQAKDVLRALNVMESMLVQGRSLTDALEEASKTSGRQGERLLEDLVARLRAAPAERQAEAVHDWTQAWESPAVNLVGAVLMVALQGRVEIAPLIATLRHTFTDVVEVLSRARSAARGVEWQARFLALFPPGVVVTIALTTPEMRPLYLSNPLLLLPVVAGSALSYLLSMRMIRQGLSVDTVFGTQGGGEPLNTHDRVGRLL